MEREKIFANYVTEKGLISWIYKELTKLTKETVYSGNGQRTWAGRIKYIWPTDTQEIAQND